MEAGAHGLRLLAMQGYYPLPDRALRWLTRPRGRTPEAIRRREILRILAAELPAAVEYLTSRRDNA